MHTVTVCGNGRDHEKKQKQSLRVQNKSTSVYLICTRTCGEKNNKTTKDKDKGVYFDFEK